MGSNRFLKNMLLLAGALFGFGESALWAYIYYVQSLSPALSVKVYATDVGDWLLDVTFVVFALLFTFQAIIIELIEIFKKR